MTAAFHRAIWTKHSALLAIFVLAVILMLPAFVRPPIFRDSWWIDIVWSEQFTQALLHGNLYPRWLPNSYDGLGAPVFYFYPPGAFYLTALGGLIGLGTYQSLLMAFFLSLCASGIGTWYFLRDWTPRPLVGAGFLLIAPYHLYDIYWRGALAECVASALLPFLAMALCRAASHRGFVWLAFAYAALVMTHMPLALITSTMFVAPYCLWRIANDRSAVWPLAKGLALGLGLAAVYLIPALGLQDYIAINQLWHASGFQPESWSVWHPSRWPLPDFQIIILVIVANIILASIILGYRDRSFWTCWTIGCCLLAIGALPYFWTLPLLNQIQFPWRAMALVEFGFVILLARSRLGPVWISAMVAPLLVISFAVLTPVKASTETTFETLKAYPDVSEYLPAGMRGITSIYWLPPASLAREGFPLEQRDGVTSLRIFYFPSWVAICPGGPVKTFPDPDTRLLTYVGHDCTPRLRYTVQERTGAAISGLALLLAFAAALHSRLRARTRSTE